MNCDVASTLRAGIQAAVSAKIARAYLSQAAYSGCWSFMSS